MQSWSATFHVLCIVWLVIRGLFWLLTLISDNKWGQLIFHLLFWLPNSFEFGAFACLPLFYIQLMYSNKSRYSSYMKPTYVIVVSILCILQIAWAIFAGLSPCANLGQNLGAVASNYNNNIDTVHNENGEYNDGLQDTGATAAAAAAAADKKNNNDVLKHCFKTEYSFAIGTAPRIAGALVFIALAVMQGMYGYYIKNMPDIRYRMYFRLDSTLLVRVNIFLTLSFLSRGLYILGTLFDWTLPAIPLQNDEDIDWVVGLCYMLWDYVPTILLVMTLTSPIGAKNDATLNSSSQRYHEYSDLENIVDDNDFNTIGNSLVDGPIHSNKSNYGSINDDNYSQDNNCCCFTPPRVELFFPDIFRRDENGDNTKVTNNSNGYEMIGSDILHNSHRDGPFSGIKKRERDRDVIMSGTLERFSSPSTLEPPQSWLSSIKPQPSSISQSHSQTILSSPSAAAASSSSSSLTPTPLSSSVPPKLVESKNSANGMLLSSSAQNRQHTRVNSLGGGGSFIIESSAPETRMMGVTPPAAHVGGSLQSQYQYMHQRERRRSSSGNLLAVSSPPPIESSTILPVSPADAIIMTQKDRYSIYVDRQSMRSRSNSNAASRISLRGTSITPTAGSSKGSTSPPRNSQIPGSTESGTSEAHQAIPPLLSPDRKKKNSMK